MKIYFAALQNTPYQRGFIMVCVRQLEKVGFDIYLAVDEFLNNPTAYTVANAIDGKLL